MQNFPNFRVFLKKVLVFSSARIFFDCASQRRVACTLPTLLNSNASLEDKIQDSAKLSPSVKLPSKRIASKPRGI